MSVIDFSRPPYPQETALIVNSQTKEREALRRFFAGADYHVLVASTGSKAVELCRHYEGAIHVLITDLNSPGLTGWKLAEKVSKIRPGMLVLFLSADYLADRCPPEGMKKPVAASLLSNPITPGMLAEVTQAIGKTAQVAKRAN